MSSEVVTLSTAPRVTEATDVVAGHGVAAAPVVDAAGKLVGMLRDEDLAVTR
jgi:CBS-domain-containing membrane protein